MSILKKENHSDSEVRSLEILLLFLQWYYIHGFQADLKKEVSVHLSLFHPPKNKGHYIRLPSS